MTTHLETLAELQGRTLLCPRCGGENLHHGMVAVFDPVGGYEDAELCRVTDISDSITIATVRNASSGNPSNRRSGIVIVFTCETCDAAAGPDLELCIAQHKGSTEIWWRYDE